MTNTTAQPQATNSTPTTSALRSSDPGHSGSGDNRLGDPSRSDKALTIGGLETVYDALATAIDQAGPDKSELFLVKLALLQAQALGDTGEFQKHVEAALQDL